MSNSNPISDSGGGTCSMGRMEWAKCLDKTALKRLQTGTLGKTSQTITALKQWRFPVSGSLQPHSVTRLSDIIFVF
jgi:hypothetical protein